MTVRSVNVPTDVIFVCAAVKTEPVKSPVTFPVRAASTVPATKVSEPTVHLSVVSFHIKVLLVLVPLSISIPPFSEGIPVSSELRVKIESPIFTVLELTVVVVPETVRLPPIVTLPEVSTVVKVPAAAVVPPITVLSTVPPEIVKSLAT